ncbi:MAG: peptide-methionine (S)-S-oxide reductase MsrA [Candidatus Thermoplasmatota archaeon]|nr:peptide-methionine (S)-S-oxide reductase MsrA [Candidatus Thermoplasmatota archaeon]
MIFGRDGEELITGEVPALDRDPPEETKTATFSLGCFWGPDATFGSLPGIVKTRVGYAGGEKRDPSYRSLGGHTETLQVDYDLEKMNYKRLLNIFWDRHDFTRSKKAQYRSMIFFHGEEQKEIASRSKRKKEKEVRGDVKTVIRGYSEFHMAEDYHQKYHLTKKKALHDALRNVYTDIEDFIDSTAVARANGYVSGHGDISSADDLKGLGLNEEGREFLYEIWKKVRGV